MEDTLRASAEETVDMYRWLKNAGAYGREQAIPAHVIAAGIGLEVPDFQRNGGYAKLRGIARMAVALKLPLFSCSKGYYIGVTEEDRDHMFDSLTSRVASMLERRANLRHVKLADVA